MGFHSHVEANEEIGEIHAQAKPVARRQLFIELVELEHSTWLILIFLDCPDVAHVDKSAQLEHPEQLAPVLDIEIESHVATLIDEAVLRLLAVEATWSQSAHTPPSHTIGTTRVEAFLKWQHSAVAIRHRHAQPGMQRHRASRTQIVCD